MKSVLYLLGVLGVLGVAPAMSFAAKEYKPGKSTVWDSLMAEQAYRQKVIGAEAFSRGDYALAVKHYARAVASNPDDPWNHILLGVAQYWSGAIDEALAAYREALKLDAKNSQAHQLMGIVFAYKNDLDNSLKEFLEAQKLSPDQPDVEMDLGSVYENLGQRMKALECFRKAASLDPKNPLYHYQLGLLYDRLGRESNAQDSLKEAIRQFAEYQDAILELAALKQRDGDLDGAATYFKKAVKLKPGDAVARLRFGVVHLLQGYPDKVSEDLDKAFTLTPEQDGGKLALSQAYSRPQAGEPQTPLDMFQRNLERIPPKQEAKVEVVISRVSSAPVKLEPAKDGGTLKNALGKSFNKGPAPVRTVREFTLAPASAEVRAAQIERILQDVRDAAAPGEKDAEVHLGMNISYPKRDFEQSAEVHPVSYEPRRVGNDLGLWVQGTGWIELVEEVVPIVEERLRGHPDDVQAKVLLGLAYLTLGNAPEARSAFEAALAVKPDSFDALLGLGVSHVISGDDAAALETYKKALALRPKDRTAKDAVKWLSTPLKKK